MLFKIIALIIIVVGILAVNILSSEEEECSGLKRKFLKIFISILIFISIFVSYSLSYFFNFLSLFIIILQLETGIMKKRRKPFPTWFWTLSCLLFLCDLAVLANAGLCSAECAAWNGHKQGVHWHANANVIPTTCGHACLTTGARTCCAVGQACCEETWNTKQIYFDWLSDGDNMLNVTLKFSPDATPGGKKFLNGDRVTMDGLVGSPTSDNNALTITGPDATRFGSVGAWNQSTGTLTLTVADGMEVLNGCPDCKPGASLGDILTEVSFQIKSSLPWVSPTPTLAASCSLSRLVGTDTRGKSNNGCPSIQAVAMNVFARFGCPAGYSCGTDTTIQTMKIISATYGSNCGVTKGANTNTLAEHCDGKTECDPRFAGMSDLAKGCGKDLVVDMKCGSTCQPISDTTSVLKITLPSEWYRANPPPTLSCQADSSKFFFFCFSYFFLI